MDRAFASTTTRRSSMTTAGRSNPDRALSGTSPRHGHLPLGYYKDEAKSKATFVVANGVRWALPGDMATVDRDGTVVLLGHGSISINTGGEKVYPEEVEAVLKGHPDVEDAVVVGALDEQWGERVVAIVQPRDGATPQLHDIQELCRRHLAHYKVPRSLHLVDEIERSPAGKPDYRWAARHREHGRQPLSVEVSDHCHSRRRHAPSLSGQRRLLWACANSGGGRGASIVVGDAPVGSTSAMWRRTDGAVKEPSWPPQYPHGSTTT